MQLAPCKRHRPAPDAPGPRTRLPLHDFHVNQHRGCMPAAAILMAPRRFCPIQGYCRCHDILHRPSAWRFIPGGSPSMPQRRRVCAQQACWCAPAVAACLQPPSSWHHAVSAQYKAIAAVMIYCIVHRHGVSSRAAAPACRNAGVLVPSRRVGARTRWLQPPSSWAGAAGARQVAAQVQHSSACASSTAIKRSTAITAPVKPSNLSHHGLCVVL